MADPKTQMLQVSLPGAGNTQSYTLTAETPIQFTFDTSEAVFTGVNGNLQITVEGGGTIILENYEALASEGTLPVFELMDGEQVAGEIYLFAFQNVDETAEEALETAADGATGGSGAGEYSDDPGSIGDGLNALGGQGDAFAGRSLLNATDPTGDNLAPIAIDDFSDDIIESGTNRDDDGDKLSGTTPNVVTGNLISNDYDSDDLHESLRMDTLDFDGADFGGSDQAAVAVPDTGFTTVAGQYGTLTVDPLGNYTYELYENLADPLREGQVEQEVFQYTIKDPNGAVSNTASLTVTVRGTNDRPEAEADTPEAHIEEAGYEVAGLAVVEGDVLQNDFDVDNIDYSDAPEGPIELSVAGIASNNNQQSEYETGSDEGGNFMLVEGEFGTLKIYENGKYTYELDQDKADYLTPEDQNIPEQFTVTVTDIFGGEDTSALTIYIDGTNDAPVAKPDTGTAEEANESFDGVAATGNVLTNDTDIDDLDWQDDGATSTDLRVTDPTGYGDTMEVTDGFIVQGEFGQLEISATGEYTYTPYNENEAVDSLNVGDSVQETFNFTVVDPDGAPDQSSLTVTVTGTNDAPVATADGGEVVEEGVTGFTETVDGAEAAVVAGNVLANDNDVDNLDYDDVEGDLPEMELSVVAADFVPQEVEPNENDMLTADEPTLNNFSGSDEGGNYYELQGQFGTLKLYENGEYEYTEDPDATDWMNVEDQVQDVFTYTVSDNEAGPDGTDPSLAKFDTTTLTITIDGANDSPVAEADTDTAVEGNETDAVVPATGNVLLDDTDVDNVDWLDDGATYTDLRVADPTGYGETTEVPGGWEVQGQYGTLLISAEGVYTYTPNGSNEAVDSLNVGDTIQESFDFNVVDPLDASDESSLTITIQGTNDAPVATADGGEVVEEGVTGFTETVDGAEAAVVAGNVLANDTDVDNLDYDDVEGDLPQMELSVVAADFVPQEVEPNGDNMLRVAEPAVNDFSGSDEGGNYYEIQGQFGTLKLYENGEYEYTENPAATNSLNIDDQVQDVFTYTVSDNEAGPDGTDPSLAKFDTTTLTITIDGANDTPVLTAENREFSEAFDDNAAAVLGGNLLANDSDVDNLDYDDVDNIADMELSIVDASYDGEGDYSEGREAPDGDWAYELHGEYGSLYIAEDGTYTFVEDKSATDPLNEDSSPSMTFNYTVSDNEAGADGTTPDVDKTAESSITITVNGTNDSPVASNDRGVAKEANESYDGKDASGNVLKNDTDIDNVDHQDDQPEPTQTDLSVTDITFGDTHGTYNEDTGEFTIDGLYGTLTIGADGEYTYDIHDGNEAVDALNWGDRLVENFFYTVEDPGQLDDTGRLRIVVKGTNDAPVAEADTNDLTETEDGALAARIDGNVLANDNDVDNVDHDTATDEAPMELSVVDAFAGTTPPETGDTELLAEAPADPTLPEADFVLEGDYGTLYLRTDGSYDYIENPGATDDLNVGDTVNDVFTYTVSDNEAGKHGNKPQLAKEDSETLTISVHGSNDTPVLEAEEREFSEAIDGNEAAVLEGNLLANDSDVDNLDYDDVDDIADMELSIVDASYDGEGDYSEGREAPDGDWAYELHGEYGSLYIAEDGTYTFVEDKSATDPLNEDINPTMTFNYTVSDNEAGADGTTPDVAKTAESSITIQVFGTNDSPVAQDNTGWSWEEGADWYEPMFPATGNVLFNDTDVDDVDFHDYAYPLFGRTSLVVSGIATGDEEAGNAMTDVDGSTEITGTYGTLTIGPDGHYVYWPNTEAANALNNGDHEQDFFTYTVKDPHGATDTATITINVYGENDGPVAKPDTNTDAVEASSRNVGEDVDAILATGNVLTNDTDVDNLDHGDVDDIADAELTVDRVATGYDDIKSVDADGTEIVSDYGTLTIHADGTYSYDPNQPDADALNDGETAWDTFYYRVNDNEIGDNETDIGRLNIKITGSNDAPIANSDGGESDLNVDTQLWEAIDGAQAGMVDGNVLANDTDVDNLDYGDVANIADMELSVTGASFGDQAADTTDSTWDYVLDGDYGTLYLNADGSYEYVEDKAATDPLNVNDTKVDTFTYDISDNQSDNALTDTATLSITVHGSNDSPVAQNYYRGAFEANESYSGTDAHGFVLGKDTDIDDLDWQDDVTPRDTDLSVSDIVFDDNGTHGTFDQDTGKFTIDGEYGQLVIGADGRFTYDINDFHEDVDALNDGDNLYEYFTYTVKDPGEATDTATLRIRIRGTNDAPEAQADGGEGQLLEDVNYFTEAVDGADAGVVAGNVLGNDTDVDNVDMGDGAPIELTVVNGSFLEEGATAPTEGGTAATAWDGSNQNGNYLVLEGDYGTLELYENGTYVYTEDKGATDWMTDGDTVTDTFTYTISDNEDGKNDNDPSLAKFDTSTLTITIAGDNDTPVAVNDADTAYEGSDSNEVFTGKVAVEADGNVLDNDTDVDDVDYLDDGSSSTSLEVSSISFEQTIPGGTTTVTKGVDEDGTVIDGKYGQLTIHSDGSYTYDPNSEYADALAEEQTASDVFTYTVEDPDGADTTALLTITIVGTNDAPVVQDSFNSALEDGSVIGNVNMGTDVDHLDASLKVTAVEAGEDVVPSGNETTFAPGAVHVTVPGQYGTLTILQDGSYIYNADKDLADTLAKEEIAHEYFTYTVTDPDGASDIATLDITVTGINDAPQAQGASLTLTEDQSKGGSIQDIDVDNGAQLTYALDGDAPTGLTFNADGTFSMNAAGNYEYLGTVDGVNDTLTYNLNYTVTDEHGATDNGVLTITINGVNDAPEGADFTVTANSYETPIDIDFDVAPITDVEDDHSAADDLDTGVRITELPEHGTLYYDEDPADGIDPVEVETGQVYGDLDAFSYVPDVPEVHGVLLGARDTDDVGLDNWGTEVNDTTREMVLDNGVTITTTLDAGKNAELTQYEGGQQHIGYGIADGKGSGLNPGETLTVSFGEATVSYAEIGFDGMHGYFNPGSPKQANATWEAYLDGELVSEGDVNNLGGDNFESLTLSGFEFDTIVFGTTGTSNPNWELRYIDAEFSQTDSFKYEPVDSEGADNDGDPYTVTINVQPNEPFNEVPEAVNDTNFVNEPNDSVDPVLPHTAEGNVLSNDEDLDNTEGEMEVTSVTFGDDTYTFAEGENELEIPGDHGTLTINRDGSYTYEATDNSLTPEDAPTETFSYTMSDGETEAPAPADLVITVQGINDAPVANDDFNEADEAADGAPEVAATGNVISGEGNPDSDADYDVDNDTADLDVTNIVYVNEAGDTVSGTPDGNGGFEIVGKYGTLHIDADGEYNYVADQQAADELAQGAEETDTFTYTVSDGDRTGSADLTITVNGVNDAPHVDLNANEGVDVFFVRETAGYENIVGVYELDDQGNPINPQIIINDQNGIPKGELVANLDPEAHDYQYFIISDGADNRFPDVDGDSVLSFDLSGDKPVLLVDGEQLATNGGQIAPVFFSQTEYNPDNLDDPSAVRPGHDAYGEARPAGHWVVDKYSDGSVGVRVEDLPNGGDNDYIDVQFILVPADGDGYSALFVENQGSVFMTSSNVDITDVDSDTMQSATITIDNAFEGDVLSVNGLPDTVEVDPASTPTSIILVAADGGLISEADLEAAIEAIKFNNTSENPDTTDREINVQVTDDFGATSNVATAIVHVVAVNDRPVAADDIADAQGQPLTTAEDTAITFSFAQLLANDTDVDDLDYSDPDYTQTDLTITGFRNAEDGSFTVDWANQEVTFTPDTDFNGEATFEYKVSDGKLSDWGTVKIDVTPVNDRPDAIDDTNEATEAVDDAALVAATGNVIDGEGNPDTDPDSDVDNTRAELDVTNIESEFSGESLSVDENGNTVIVGQYGTLTIDSNGEYSYVADQDAANELGPDAEGITDTFTYTLSDAAGAGTEGLEDTATLTFSINGVNDAPTAIDDSAQVDEDSTTGVKIDVLANDTDPEGDDLTIDDVTNGAHGSVVINSDGTVTYTPTDANWNGTDTFTYTISDEDGLESTGTVTVTVNPVEDPTVIVEAPGGDVYEDQDVTAANTLEYSGEITFTDADDNGGFVEGEASDVLQPGQEPNLGTLEMHEDGSWDYSVSNEAVQYLNDNETKVETFEVETLDGQTTTVSVTIHGENDNVAPVAVDDRFDTANDYNVVSEGGMEVQAGSINYLLVVDTSGSMGWYNRMDNTKAALDNMMETLQSQLNLAGEGSATVGIIGFDSGSSPISDYRTFTLTPNSDVADLTNEASTFINDDDTLEADGGTNYGPAFGLANTWLADADGGNNGNDTHVIFMSDGAPNYSNYADAVATLKAPEDVELTAVGIELNNNTNAINIITGIDEGHDPILLENSSDLNPLLQEILAPVEIDATTASGDVTLNDRDDDGDTLFVESIALGEEGTDGQTFIDLGNDGKETIEGEFGTLTINEDGTYDYTPDQPAANALGAGESGVDEFTYTVSDRVDGNDPDTATVSFKVLGTNDAPVAIEDSYNEINITTTSETVSSWSDNDGDLSSITMGNMTFTAKTEYEDNPQLTLLNQGSRLGVHNDGDGDNKIDSNYSDDSILVTFNDGPKTSVDLSFHNWDNNDFVRVIINGDRGNPIDMHNSSFTLDASQINGVDSFSSIELVAFGWNNEFTLNSITANGGPTGDSIDPVSGNVIDNDLQVDTNDVLTVANIEGDGDTTILADGNGDLTGFDVDGEYGTLHIDVNGDWTYTLNSDGLPADSATETFEYTVSDGELTDTAALNIPIHVNATVIDAADANHVMADTNGDDLIYLADDATAVTLSDGDDTIIVDKDYINDSTEDVTVSGFDNDDTFVLNDLDGQQVTFGQDGDGDLVLTINDGADDVQITFDNYQLTGNEQTVIGETVEVGSSHESLDSLIQSIIDSPDHNNNG